MPINKAAKEAAKAQVAQFIDERCEMVSPLNDRGFIDPDKVLTGREAFAAYRAWYATTSLVEDGHRPELTLTAFGKAMGAFVQKFRTNAGIEYRGIRVRA